MKRSPILSLFEISKRFLPSAPPAIDKVSLTLGGGEILGLLGPSGCGKTTLLRVVAGFERPCGGSIELAGRVVADEKRCIPPEKRDAGMVFQDHALFPHLTTGENIAFGLKTRGEKRSREEIRARVGEILRLVALEGLEGRYPYQLSGGQQQRVALARALAPKPSLILLDEPLSSLDAPVRQRLRHEIRHVLKATGTSAIFVTHDREEAMTVCDTIAVIGGGKLEQIDTPEAIYSAPATRFVAEFVTGANFVPAIRAGGDRWRTEIGDWEIPGGGGWERGELMVREEDIALKPDEGGELAILDRQFLGREYRYCLVTPSGNRLHARTTTDTRLSVGTRVTVSLAPDAARVFPG